ncbi:MAG: M81 family metallopeptidase [Ardenticatenaceae bacterium]|nr:M81 family metallopeptidase [Ardenticatenaceae bacterium]
MRVVIGGISHETSTFTPVQTTWESYHERFYLQGVDIITTFEGTNTPLGGFIDAGRENGIELLPTVFAEPHPSGPTPRPIFDDILQQLLTGIDAAGSIDGILLELHGSMVVGDLDGPDGLDDPEGFLLAALRNQVGPTVPILAQLDIHANISPQMVETADVLIGRETYPEIDMAERGRECVTVLRRIWHEGLRPTMALYQIPMIWGLRQATAHPPMREAINRLHELESRPGVVCASIAVCYFLADVPHMGSSVYVVTDNDAALAQTLARELGEWCFARRAAWHYELPTTHEALKLAEAAGDYPVIFADSRDNPGGGGPGDSTGLLRTFIEAGLQEACVLYIVDPEVIAACHAAGVGRTLTMPVGGKSSPLQGEPLMMTFEVTALSGPEGRFRYDGPMYAGLEGKMGPSAAIRQGGVHVILVTIREQPFDTAFARSLGIDPRQMRYIGVKSTAHFRAGFEPWAGAIYLVSESSVHNLGHLPFKRLGRKVYPLDDI